MTALALGLVLAPMQYSFEPGSKHLYDSKITFEGFIPILGGNEGTVVVSLGVTVEGMKAKKAGQVSAANEIVSFSVTFNDAPLPLDVTSVQAYFPLTTISLAPNGKIIETDAPNIQLPVRLPGLDVKRFPDITYVPIQFPEKDAAVGEKWTFKRTFGESDVNYACEFLELKGDVAKIAVSIVQEYEVFENSALEVVDDEADAERKVKTRLTGQGFVHFDTKKGIVTRADMVNDAVSDATKLSDGSKSQRKLKTTFSLALRENKPPVTKEPEAWYQSAWRAVSEGSKAVVAKSREWYAMTRLAIQIALGHIPGIRLPFGG